MDILDKVKTTIDRRKMFEEGETVVVAVSGGPDSVALLHLLWRLKGELKLHLHVAHLNHGIRGEEAKKDSKCVTQLAAKLDCPFTSDTVDVVQLVKDEGGSLEEKAREVRYGFLKKVAQDVGATKIATGHNADDQAETVLMWLLRGAGPTGLRGIPSLRDECIVRPLIDVTRDEIERYIVEHGLPWRQDTSNLDTRHFRNKIRNELLPQLKRDYSPHFTLRASHLADLMEEEEDFFRQEVKRILPTLVKWMSTNKIILDVQSLLMYHLGLRRRILRHVIRLLKGDLQDILYKHVQILLQALDSKQTGLIIHLPGNMVSERTSGTLILRKGQRISYDREMIVPGRTELPEIESALVTEHISAVDIGTNLKGTEKKTGLFDQSLMNGHLRVRTRRPGDIFQPLGMKGTKKLQDFFVDEKISRLERQEIPLLTVDDEIAWVVGRRIADKFKVTDSSREILKVNFVHP